MYSIESNKVKLQVKLEDIELKECNLDNPKEYKIRLTSKSKAFEEIKFRSKDYKNWKYAQEFYTTLNKVAKYQISVNMLKNKTFFFETSADTGSKSVSDSKAVTMTSNDKIDRESRESIYSDAKDLTKISNKDTPTLNIDPENQNNLLSKKVWISPKLLLI